MTHSPSWLDLSWANQQLMIKIKPGKLVTLWLDRFTSWEPLFCFRECLSGADIKPCLLWAAVMWVRSISVTWLSVWLHLPMLPAKRPGRSPWHRSERTPSWSVQGKVEIKEREGTKRRESLRRSPSFPYSPLLRSWREFFERSLWIYCHKKGSSSCKELGQNKVVTVCPQLF